MTIGPRGRNVVIRRGVEDPVVINDGVSIAMEVELDEPEEQVGAKLLVQACSKTDSRAGDGTTTSAVLTQALCNIGAKYVSNGANSVALQRGLCRGIHKRRRLVHHQHGGIADGDAGDGEQLPFSGRQVAAPFAQLRFEAGR